MSTAFKKLITIKLKQSSAATTFLALMKKSKIPIYQLNFHQNSLTFQVARSHLPLVRKLRKKASVKISIRYSEPEKILQKDLITLIGLLVLLIIPLVLSRFIWHVEVDAQTVELEDEVMQYLQGEMGMEFPVGKSTFISDNEIRQLLMMQFREFSWVHIMKNGSKVTITPQLAPKIKSLKSRIKINI